MPASLWSRPRITLAAVALTLLAVTLPASFPSSASAQVSTLQRNVSVGSDQFEETIGATHTASVFLYDYDTDLGNTFPVPGVVLRYEITGANPSTGALPATDVEGETSLTWTGVNGGHDQLVVYQDDNANLQFDGGEPAGFDSAEWLAALGPATITQVFVGADLSCQVRFGGDSEDEFGGGIPGRCGTYVTVDGQTYGPDEEVSLRTPFARVGRVNPDASLESYTRVSQTAQSGSGTAADPFRITTIVCAGSTGCDVGTDPLIRQDVSWVTGGRFFRTDVTVMDRSGAKHDIGMYQYGDCNLQNHFEGFGFRDGGGGGIYCSETPNNSPPNRVVGFVPISAGSSYEQGEDFEVEDRIIEGEGAVLPDLCRCDEFLDYSAALGWGALTLPASGTVRRSLLTAFSATTPAPPALTLSSPAPGAQSADSTPTYGGGAGERPQDAGTVTVEIFAGPSIGAAAPLRTLGVARSGASWSIADPTALAPGTYTARARQGNADGFEAITRPTTFTILAAPLAPPPIGPLPDRDRDGIPDVNDTSDASVGPTLGRTVIGQVVSGQVFIQRPPDSGLRGGARARQTPPQQVPGSTKGLVPLKGAEVVPVGSLLDTRRGRVAITSVAGMQGTRRLTQRAEFYKGRFKVRQRRAKRPVTDIALQSPTLPKACSTSTGGVAAFAAKPSRKVIRRLGGNGKGRFRTRGRHSAATVRGTIWLTQERCDGTLTTVIRGTVSVRDTTAHRTVIVRTGRSYLARAQRAAAKTTTP